MNYPALAGEYYKVKANSSGDLRLKDTHTGTDL
jgi:hypothetical protein